MICQKIIRGLLSLLVVVSLSVPSLHAIRPEATHSSTVLKELQKELQSESRSELRVESTVYDYQGIADPEVRSLVRRRELEIKDVMIRNFSWYLQEVLDLESRQANEIEEILQTVASDHQPKGGDIFSKFADTDYASRYAASQIRKVISPDGYDAWKLEKVEEVLGTEMWQFIYEILSYKLLFAGFDMGQNKRGEAVIGMFRKWILDAYFNPLTSGRLTVSFLPEFQEVEDERFYDADYFKKQTGWNDLINRRHKRKHFSRLQTEKMNVEVTRILEEIIEKIRLLKKPTQIYEFASPKAWETIAGSINRIMVDHSGSVQPLKKTNEEAAKIADEVRRTVLGKLALNQSRIVNTGIVFYYDGMNLPAHFLKDLKGEDHNVPPVPIWVLPNGLITLNIRHLDKIPFILEGVLKLPDDFEGKVAEGVFQVYAPRSEMRKASPQSTVRRPQAFFSGSSIQVPVIPPVEGRKALSGRAAFGIKAQEAFVIDAKLIQTRYDLAVLFAIFNHSPFVVLANDPETPSLKAIQAINETMPVSERVALAFSVEESLQLLNQKIAHSLRQADAYGDYFNQKRFILSHQTSLDAVGLKKQFGDHFIVKTFSLDKFSEIAFGIASRSDINLVPFARELQEKVLNQLHAAQSA